jgi:hypothetical protein
LENSLTELEVNVIVTWLQLLAKPIVKWIQLPSCQTGLMPLGQANSEMDTTTFMPNWTDAYFIWASVTSIVMEVHV